MAQVGVVVDYGTKGADKAKKTNDEVLSGLQKMQAMGAGVAVVGNQMLEIGEKALRAAKAVYEFGKEGAKAAGVEKDFNKFEKNMGNVVSRLQESTAAALANSGAFEFIEVATSALLPPIENLLKIVGLLEPAFIVMGQAIELALLPTNALFDAVGFLVDEFPNLDGSLESSIGWVDKFSTSIDKAVTDVRKLKRAQMDLQLFNDAINQGFGDDTKATFEAYADQIQALTWGGADYAMSLDEINSQLMMNSESEGDYRSKLEATAKILQDRGDISSITSAKLTALAASAKEAFELDNELSDENADKVVKNNSRKIESLNLYEISLRTFAANTVQSFESWETPIDRLYDKLNSLFEKQTEINETFAESRSIFKIVQDGMKATGNAVLDLTKISGDYTEGEKKGVEQRNAALEAGLGGVARLAVGFMDSGWMKAGFEAAMETGYSIADFASANIPGGIGHALAATQFLVAQAFAGSKSGKGSSSGGGSSAAIGAATINQNGAQPKAEPKDKNLVLEVDGQRLGNVVTKNVNRNAKYGKFINQESIRPGGRKGIFS